MQLPSSPENRTDALTFVEVGTNIERVFAVTIPDKTSATVLPLILNNFVMGTTIYTDEGPLKVFSRIRWCWINDTYVLLATTSTDYMRNSNSFVLKKNHNHVSGVE
jgi:hypothetical protein